MEPLGILTLAGHRFPIHQATFRRITDNGQGQPGWELNVYTQPPLEEPNDESERFMFANGVRFYAEGDPIPLPDVEDLTGVEIYLKEPFDPDSGEVYFTLFVGEHEDVSDVTLRFVERRGSKYRLQVSALAHHVFKDPVKLTIDTWIERLPAGRYGSGNSQGVP
jgi:hypothetical protein